MKHIATIEHNFNVTEMFCIENGLFVAVWIDTVYHTAIYEYYELLNPDTIAISDEWVKVADNLYEQDHVDALVYKYCGTMYAIQYIRDWTNNHVKH